MQQCGPNCVLPCLCARGPMGCTCSMALTCLHASELGYKSCACEAGGAAPAWVEQAANLIPGNPLIQCAKHDKGHTLPGMILMAHLLWSSSPGPFVVPCLTQPHAVNIMQSPWAFLQPRLTENIRQSHYSQLLQPQRSDASMPQSFDMAKYNARAVQVTLQMTCFNGHLQYGAQADSFWMLLCKKAHVKIFEEKVRHSEMLCGKSRNPCKSLNCTSFMMSCLELTGAFSACQANSVWGIWIFSTLSVS